VTPAVPIAVSKAIIRAAWFRFIAVAYVHMPAAGSRLPPRVKSEFAVVRLRRNTTRSGPSSTSGPRPSARRHSSNSPQPLLRRDNCARRRRSSAPGNRRENCGQDLWRSCQRPQHQARPIPMRLHDLTLAVRNLLRRPAYTFTAVLLLALGAGANAAVFSVGPRCAVAASARTRSRSDW
jgi:hypothetical protein